MSGDLTQKQENFALAFLETGNATEAYRRAYDVEENARDSWLHVEACQLLSNPKIAQRVQALREEAKTLAIYNVSQAAEEYEEARLLAISEKNPSAAVGATTGKVKLYGLEVPAKWRLEHTGKNGDPIKTEEVGQGAAKVLAVLEAIAERSGTISDPDA